MNYSPCLVLLSFVVVLSSCSVQQGVGSFEEVGYDPLVTPGTRRLAEGMMAERISVGSYVEVSEEGAGFYKQKPKHHSKPDGRLSLGSPLQVIGEAWRFYQVRQVINGTEGYVMKSAVSNQPVLADTEPPDIGVLAALVEGTGVVDPSLMLLPEGEGALLVNVPDDGVDGGEVVADSTADEEGRDSGRVAEPIQKDSQKNLVPGVVPVGPGDGIVEDKPRTSDGGGIEDEPSNP